MSLLANMKKVGSSLVASFKDGSQLKVGGNNRWSEIIPLTGSSITANGVFYTVRNLVIGRVYEVNAVMHLFLNSGGVDTSVTINIVHNGNTLITMSEEISGTDSTRASQCPRIFFTASIATLTFELAGGGTGFSGVLGDSPGNNGSMKLWVVERNDLLPQSDDFA